MGVEQSPKVVMVAHHHPGTPQNLIDLIRDIPETMSDVAAPRILADVDGDWPRCSSVDFFDRCREVLGEAPFNPDVVWLNVVDQEAEGNPYATSHILFALFLASSSFLFISSAVFRNLVLLLLSPST